MIRLTDVTLCPGGEPVVEDVSWHIHAKEHVGLVGRNGSGKTTVLRAIAKELSPDRGKVLLREGASVGYLPQQAVADTSQTVWDEARTGMVRLNQLGKTLDAAQLAVDEDRPGAIERHAEAMEVFRVAGGFSQEETIGSVLYGLGFAKTDWQRPCSTFSGGWQMRIALARLLLAQPDVALLDEPTNHLDLAARTWLAHFLSRAPFTVVVVAHDRHLLDQVATRIAEVHMNEVHHYTGNFTAFLRQRRERREQQLGLYKRQQKEIV
ncbi:MAG: ABC-F family ATP-binding cassette domain-containing protein, partial [Proteobacteria bacterium]|nr:ABC-F family ATP-binding cassette domain-containing protein [Pseudomonadota bacterium]